MTEPTNPEPLFRAIDGSLWRWNSFRSELLPVRAAAQKNEDAIGAAEREVGRYVYRRIEALMDAKAGTPDAAELAYLARVAECVEEYGEEACDGSKLADFPAATPNHANG